MKISKTTFFASLLITLIIGAFFGYWLFQPGTEEVVEHDMTTHIDEWTCSMHPQVRQPEAGKCPICGMDLIPAEDPGNEEGSMMVRMSETAMKLADVRTAPVERGSFSSEVQLNGTIESDERLQHSQAVHIEGRIENLNVTFEGEKVNKGQLIAKVYSPNLVNAQEELKEAARTRESQPELYDAAVGRLKNWKITDDQIERIINEGIIKEFPVVAEYSGYIRSIDVRRGDYVRQGQVIYTVVDQSRVWAVFDVYEDQLSEVVEGATLTFSVRALPGKEFEATVDYIDPSVDTKGRIARVRADVRNPKGLLKPGMFATARIESIEDRNDLLIVPASAVLWTGERSVVYVRSADKDGVFFTMREVELGDASGDHYPVLGGLEEGEIIAVNGAFSIDAAAQLRGQPSMMNRQEDAEKDSQEESPTGEETSAIYNGDPSALPEEFSLSFSSVVDAYLAMKDEFVSSDAATASSAAANFSSELKTLNLNLLSDDQLSKWKSTITIMDRSAQVIAETREISEQRENFSKISQQLYESVKAVDIPMTIYWQYCPMAFDNTGGFWLSDQERIANPYFGEAMLRCGSVEETLSSEMDS